MCLAFFLIVPSVIVVTIFLVHSIAQRIGFKVKYFSLVLCAIMSLAVNFAAIELSTYLDKWHYIRLGALIFVASLIVTLINRYLIKHEKSEIKVIIDDAEFEEELALEEETVAKNSTKIPISQTTEIKSSETSVIKTTLPKPKKDIIITKTKSSETIVTKIPIPRVKSSETITAKSTISKAKSSEITVIKTTLLDKKLTPKKEEDKKSSITIKKPVDSKSKEKPFEKKITKSEKFSPQSIQTSVKPHKVEDKAQTTKPIISPKEDKIADINAHLGSLDDILDYAYAQKSKGDLNQAVIAYQKALDRYKNDDYAPFIAIDLGNIYKEQAAYTKFIKTYEEALKLPVVMRNLDTRKEFNKTLTYMRIVQSVLIRHRALTMPFSKIPRQYLQEIETEFKALQLNRR